MKLPSRIKRKLNLRNFFTFMIPVSIAILLIVIYNLSRSVEHLSLSLINEATGEATLSIRSRFEPVEEIVKSIGSWKFEDKSTLYEPEALNARLIPTIYQSAQMSSMMIASTDGSEFMLLQAGDKWNNRITRPSGDSLKSARYLWDYRTYQPDSLIRKWREYSNYDPRTRLWFKGALARPCPNQIYWTPPYIFFTTREPGITASVYSFSEKGDTIITAFDVLLKDVNRISQDIQVTPNGMVCILTRDNLRVAGLPALERFMDPDSVNHYILQNINDLDIPVLSEALINWEENARPPDPFRFKHRRNNWWVGIQPISTAETDNIFYAVVLLPEKDFMAEMNRTQWVIIAGFSLVLILTILVIRAYSQIRKTNTLLARKNLEIERKNKEIEEKNKQITDSIIYAQRIQWAILPHEEKISDILPSSFVFYEPKDIVSGDFYWIEERKELKFFAAVDCTGHGVPGAFVSIVGNDGLNRALREYKLMDTDRIMSRLNGIVSETFQQSVHSDVKDGMDMALCALDTNSMTLQYSGARNPLYLVRKQASSLLVNDQENEPVVEENGYSLFEVKADRLGIEPREEMPEFTRHTIQVKPQDLVYVFSDGFADQFGGDKEKKYNYKRLKQKLLSLASLDPREQKQALVAELNRWKGDIEQIDDILIMGVRIPEK